MNTFDMFLKCEPQPIEDIIMGLAREQRAKAESNEPLSAVTFMLGNGTSVSGNFFKVKEERNETIILLASNTSFTYIPMRSIAGVQVNNPINHLNLLSGGSVPFSPDTKPIGNLDLRRIGKATEEELQAKFDCKLVFNFDFDNYPKEDAVNLNLSILLQTLEPAFSKLCTDDLGKEAIAGITEIKFCHGERWAAQMEGTNISLTVNLAKALPADLPTLLENSISELF